MMTFDFQPIIGAVLVIAGMSIFAGPILRQLWQRVSGDAPDAPSVSTDAEPPAGFVEHAELILAASPEAPADVQVTYLSAGLTQAQTLWRENARLREAQQ